MATLAIPNTRRRRRRLPVVAAAVVVLAGVAIWMLSVRLLAPSPDPYGVGTSAVAQFRQQYPNSLPLSVRVAHTTLGWVGVCEGVAWLTGERAPQAILRLDGSLLINRFGTGRGLWVVETTVVRNPAWRTIVPGPPPPWHALLPFGVDRPLIGSLQ